MAPDRNSTLVLRQDSPTVARRSPKLSDQGAASPNWLWLSQVFHAQELPPLARRAIATAPLPTSAHSPAPVLARSNQDLSVRPFGSHRYRPPADAPAPASRKLPASDRRWRIS